MNEKQYTHIKKQHAALLALRSAADRLDVAGKNLANSAMSYKDLGTDAAWKDLLDAYNKYWQESKNYREVRKGTV